MTRLFSDRLIETVRAKGPLCVGIDPHPDKFPRLFGSPSAGAIAVWADGIIDVAKDIAGVVKPQAAFFERWGSAGMAALEHVCKTAREAGMLVILDAKRGDIGSTARGYAEAYLGAGAGCPCDAITVNPFMGIETVEPFLSVAAEQGKGVAVLARTSNPGAADLQEQVVEGRPLFQTLTEKLYKHHAPLVGDLGWSGLMLVAGATAPAEARALREIAPKAITLVPGYGAQGAGADDAVAGFIGGPDGVREGGVVNASRSVTFPDEAHAANTVADWEAAIRTAIQNAQNDLVAATRRPIVDQA